MTDSYKDLIAATSANTGKLREDIPDVMRGFGALSQAASADGVLDKKTKELIGMALAVGSRCDPCIGFHARSLVKVDTSREELMEMLGMCIYMGGGPSLMYAARAVGAFEEFGSGQDEG